MKDKYSYFRDYETLPAREEGHLTGSKEHIAISRQVATEGIVLLKNENHALPLAKNEKVALFGKATVDYIKGGGGSGDVYCAYVKNLYDGFAGKIETFQPLHEFYENYINEAKKNLKTFAELSAPYDEIAKEPYDGRHDDILYRRSQGTHVTECEVPEALIHDAASFARTAIIMISRFSEEGVDRRAIKGDYYISDIEETLIEQVTKSFEKVILVLNVGGPIDLSFAKDNKAIQAIVEGYQGGMEGALALADILCGDVNPSGKLADTFVKSYEDYPSAKEFTESFDYLNYSEDIFNGYRYYLTIPGAKEKILFPFGYGLSYTQFDIKEKSAKKDKNQISIEVLVQNIGTCAGKEVVEIYGKAPNGRLDKVDVQLVAFGKTKELQPGEEQVLTLSFSLDYMTSYDDLGKIQTNAFLLEKGTYRFFMTHEGILSLKELDFRFALTDTEIVLQSKPYLAPVALTKRLRADGTFENLESASEDRTCGECEIAPYMHTETEKDFYEIDEQFTLSDFVNQWTIDEMANFIGGAKPVGVNNICCFNELPRLGVPEIGPADGPAGLRLFEQTNIPTTSFPCATLRACTRNQELIEKLGQTAAKEVREVRMGVWLSPAMNIHRNPLCGRNFEYLSEDPVLSGKMAAAEIRGIQSQKVACSLKHFACNNKESNRYHSDSRISMRALRELYLRGFEIAVKEANPWTVMSSYNEINGVHTSESWSLLTGILRNEWGFTNMITTDWGEKNNPALEAKAGNDAKMHLGYPEDLKQALSDGIITTDHLKRCVMRILSLYQKLGEE